jgi:hypothetical protein
MKKIHYFIILGILLTFTSQSQDVSYKVGEKVTYTVRYGLISAGTASLELKSDQLDGNEVWHSVLYSKTTGVADRFFKVLDIYESFIDPETELPVKSIRNIHEGRYRKYNVVLFDHKTRADSAILMSDLTGRHIAQKGIQDILSCFYFFRNHILPDDSNLVKGRLTTITTWFTDELYPVMLRYKGMEVVKTKAGKINCYKFNPVTETGRLFKTEEDVSFWFSADKNFLPVKIRFDIFVGAFEVEISDYKGLIYPLDIKKK